MKTEYTIVEAYNLADLVEAVNEKTRDGWGIVGGHCEVLDAPSDMYWCSQSMVRVVEEDAAEHQEKQK